MLLKYGAKNFFCFKEGIEISLELGANCPSSISKGKNTANLLCVKGANGSGKTNALKIISILKIICSDSFSNKPDENLDVHSYFYNDNPIDLFCDFKINGIQYRYETSLTNDHIITETLMRKKKRLTEVFRREKNQLKNCINEFADLKHVKLRSNASIISTAHQYESKSISQIYAFFNTITTNVSWSGRYDFPNDYKFISKFYKKDPRLFKFAKNIIKKSDLGIKNIKLLTRKDEEGGEFLFPVFEHTANVKNNLLTFFSQSSGTKALYNIMPYYYYVLEVGGILVLDEFDVNFHPDMLPPLVSMFDNEQLNKKNAQLVFTTHNTEIVDYMGKYRTFLVNQEESESYGYRLDEIPGDLLRNDRPITPIYRDGKIGGVPKI